MAQYKYTAQDRNGKKTKGTMTAADETELQHRLREKDLFFLSASEIKGRRGRRQFRDNVLSDFSRQLGTLAAAGVSLVRALNIIVNGEAIKPKEREVYEDLLRQIRQGIALSDAMEAQGGAFPSLMIYMYRSAETSGNLDEVALKMAVLYEKEHQLKGKISSALTYPKILGFMVIAVILIITNYVLPQLQELLDMMEELPITTKILFMISDFMMSYWYIVIGIAVALWIFAKWLMTVPSARRQWHKALLHLPGVGKLMKVICTARFSRTLSSLYAAGIPIVSALQIARSTAGNDYIDSQFDEAITHIRGGSSLSEGLGEIDGLVSKLRDAVKVGEETGSVDSMLLSVSDALEFDADIAIAKLVSYVGPVMLIIMGGVVAFVMLSVFGAIYGSYDAIANMA